MTQRTNPASNTPSRRRFLRHAVAGAGATAAAALGGKSTGAAPAADQDSTRAIAPIRVPAEFAASTSAAPKPFAFPMTGAQVFARACKEEGVAALFACPGNYPVIHAIASAGIPAFGGRHEGSMAHAADAFIRVTGELAATSGTEGPGFTDMICAIACANAARTPLLVLASNMSMFNEDTEAGIQLGEVLQEALALALPTRVVCADTEACDKRTDALLTPARAESPFSVLMGFVPGRGGKAES